MNALCALQTTDVKYSIYLSHFLIFLDTLGSLMEYLVSFAVFSSIWRHLVRTKTCILAI